MVTTRLKHGSEAGTTISLGEQIRNRPIYSPQDSSYLALANKLSAELVKISDREQERAASKKTVVLVQSLDVSQQGLLEREYPEYDIRYANLQSPVHKEFVARRAMAGEFMRDHLRKFVPTSVHIGGNIINAVLQGDEGAHFEFNEDDPVAVNYGYESAVALMQVATAASEMKKHFGIDVPHGHYQQFLAGKCWRRCGKQACCDFKAEGLSVDLSLQAMPVTQVLAAMIQTGASIGLAALPYHPMMLQLSEGELPGVGVHFQVNDNVVMFKYPQGVAGVSSFPYMAWHEWLAVNHREVTTVRGKKVFRFERKVYRGSFMFVEITEVDPNTPPPRTITHALDLHSGKGLVKVKVYRLKGFARDVDDPDSWEAKDCVFTESVVNKLYEVGMSLPNGQFNKYALIKRASVVDARITTEGTSVSISPALLEGEMLDLVMSVHARCFVDRYTMGKLNTEMRNNLDKVMSYSRMNWAQKFMATLMSLKNGTWDYLLAGAMDKLRINLDRLRTFFGGIPSANLPLFEKAPTYVTLTEESDRWLAVWRTVMETNVFQESFLRGVRGTYIMPAISVRKGRSVGAESLEVFFRTGRVETGVVDTSEPGDPTSMGRSALDAMLSVNDMGSRTEGSAIMGSEIAVPTEDAEPVRPDYNVDPDYVGTLTSIHEKIFPGMALQDYSLEAASLALDPQHRDIDAKLLKLPIGASELPPERSVYKGKIRAYNVEKRAQTTPELLGAVVNRNMSAPRLALTQNTEVMYPQIWETFLDTMCRPEARELLKQYQADVAVLTKEGFEDWTKKAKPNTLESLVGEVQKLGKSFEEYNVGDYLAMLKSDAKPPLSDKTIKGRQEAQVIVHHPKVLSSLYSSIFRVLARRFESLLKKNIMLNLYKDRSGTRDFIQANHPWGAKSLRYLENDFSKYDKSQGEFVFGLEAYIFEQLGMNQQLLDRWMEGHRECKIRAFSLGMSFDVDYQRKSGDATTALGNGILNIVSVAFAYKGTEFEWGVFMGDDSLVCARGVMVTDDAPQILAEIFNLQAKFYVTSAPYFASAFVNLDDENHRVTMVPDPVKLTQRWSQSVDAKDPQWTERWVSAKDSCAAYLYRLNHAKLASMVRERYPAPEGADTQGFADAVATAISTPAKFRELHEAEPTVIRV